MSTLLKAHLLKTNNPIVMFECYLESVYGTDINTILKGNLARLTDTIIRTEHPIKLDEDVEDAFLRLKSGMPIDEDSGEELSPEESEMRIEFFDKDRKNITIPKKRFIPKEGEIDAHYEQISEKDYPKLEGEFLFEYDRQVREKNVINFRNALKNSEIYKNNPVEIRHILNALNDLIEAIQSDRGKEYLTQQSQYSTTGAVRHEDVIDEKKKKEKKFPEKKKLKELYDDILALKNNLGDLKPLDRSGELEYNADIEEDVFKLIKDKHDIAKFRKMASDNYKELLKVTGRMTWEKEKRNKEILRIQKKINELLNSDALFVHKEGVKTWKLIDALLYVYEQKIEVELLDPKYHHKINAIERSLKRLGEKDREKQLQGLLKPVSFNLLWKEYTETILEGLNEQDAEVQEQHWETLDKEEKQELLSEWIETAKRIKAEELKPPPVKPLTEQAQQRIEESEEERERSRREKTREEKEEEEKRVKEAEEKEQRFKETLSREAEETEQRAKKPSKKEEEKEIWSKERRKEMLLDYMRNDLEKIKDLEKDLDFAEDDLEAEDDNTDLQERVKRIKKDLQDFKKLFKKKYNMTVDRAKTIPKKELEGIIGQLKEGETYTMGGF